MDSPQLICCSGKFPFVHCFTTSVLDNASSHKISLAYSGQAHDWKHEESSSWTSHLEYLNPKMVHTQKPISLNRDNNFTRICRVRFIEDSDRRCVAVAGLDSPHAVLTLDLGTQQIISAFTAFMGPIWGLACLPSSISSNPVLVGGGYGYLDRVFVFDAIRGTPVGDLPGSSSWVGRIHHNSRWKSTTTAAEKVFVAAGRDVLEYDLFEQKLVRRFGGSSTGSSPNSRPSPQQQQHSEFIHGLADSVSKSILFSASKDMTVQIWPMSSSGSNSCASSLHCLQLSGPAQSCYYAENRNLLFVGLMNGKIELWDPRKTSRRLNWFRASKGTVRDIGQFDSSQFVAGTGDMRLVTWDVSLRRVTMRREMPSSVYGVCTFGGEGEEESEKRQLMEEKLQFVGGLCPENVRIEFVGDFLTDSSWNLCWLGYLFVVSSSCCQYDFQ